MKKVYLDNAATTPMYDEVISEMLLSMRTVFGNPSSSHSIGRSAKAVVENSRKYIAKVLKVSASEIIFTSGGTEANNLILRNAVTNLGVKRIISSKIEHHAVLNTIQHLKKEFNLKVDFVSFDSNGQIDLSELRNLLADNSEEKTLVSLMHVNNEIGSILPLKKVAVICKEYQAYFHSDTVQSIGHFDLDLQDIPVDFITASAHKFHGPKGIGFAFFRKGLGIQPMIFGGEQEKGARAGTEAVHLILGMEIALFMSVLNLQSDIAHIKNIKSNFITQLKEAVPSVNFNVASNCLEKSTHTVINVRFAKEIPMLLFQLDLKGIAVSGGSACQSGANKGSHVLQEFLSVEDAAKTSVRFSFSKFTTLEEISHAISVLKELV